MALRLLPDAEALTVAFLRADDTVQGLVDQRVSTQLPAVPVFPLVLVTGITGREVIRAHLDEQVVQLGAWADDEVTAALVARAVRAVMLTAPQADHELGAVTHTRTVSPPRPVPDPVSDRPRYLFDMGVVVRPHPL